jgi:hypothetical protein
LVSFRSASRQPIPSIHNQVSEIPVIVVEIEVIDRAYLTVSRFDRQSFEICQMMQHVKPPLRGVMEQARKPHASVANAANLAVLDGRAAATISPRAVSQDRTL